jgi:hypothetical protein
MTEKLEKNENVEIVPSRKAELGEGLLQKAFNRLVELELLSHDPVFRWRVVRQVPGVVKEIAELLKHDLDLATVSKLSDARTVSEIRTILQDFVTKQELWGVRSEEREKIEALQADIEDDPDGVIWKRLFINEAVRQRTLMVVRMTPDQRFDVEYWRAVDEFLDKVESVIRDGKEGDALLRDIYHIVLRYFIEEESINIWLALIAWLLEKQYHLPKHKRRKLEALVHAET